MSTLIPSEPWLQLSSDLVEMQPHVDDLVELGNHDIEGVKRVADEINSRFQDFYQRVWALRDINENFKRFFGHDLVNKLFCINSALDGLRKNSKKSIREIVVEFLGKSDRVEELDEDFYERLYIAAIEFCLSGKEPEDAKPELREMIQLISDDDYEDDDWIFCLRDLLDQKKSDDLDELRTLVKDNLGFADPSQEFYDSLYDSVVDFCLSDAEGVADISDELGETIAVIDLSEKSSSPSEG